MLSIRKIGVIGRTYRHLNRYRQILAVLFKYGFGDLLEMLKIDQYIEVGLQMISKKSAMRVERLKPPQFAKASKRRFFAEARFYIEMERTFFEGMKRLRQGATEVEEPVIS